VCVAPHDRSLPLENVRFKSISSVSYCILFYDTDIYNLMLSLAFAVLFTDSFNNDTRGCSEAGETISFATGPTF